MTTKPTDHTHAHHGMSFWPQWHENKPFALVLLILGAYLIIFLNAKITETIKQTDEIGDPTPFEHTIVVDGQGKVTGTPDIATITLGIDTKAPDVVTAQPMNSAIATSLLEKVKALGISEDDIQTTAYNVYENTTWNPETNTSESQGWIVSQTLTVKVRDTSKISTLLDVAGKNGVTTISGPSFTIDDPSNLKAEARDKAVADAESKARALADRLGVRLDGVVGYSEYTDQGPMPYYADALGMGGAAKSIEPGTNEVNLNVSITYKLAD